MQTKYMRYIFIFYLFSFYFFRNSEFITSCYNIFKKYEQNKKKIVKKINTYRIGHRRKKTHDVDCKYQQKRIKLKTQSAGLRS